MFSLKSLLVYFSNITVIIMFFIAILSLSVDGKTFKKLGYIKELKILKGISYSYIFLGVLLFAILRFK